MLTEIMVATDIARRLSLLAYSSGVEDYSVVLHAIEPHATKANRLSNELELLIDSLRRDGGERVGKIAHPFGDSIQAAVDEAQRGESHA
ncbi:MAG: hypothetical protein AAGC91_01125 [Pseudomonadota bacterium]